MKSIKKFFKFILYDWWMSIVVKVLQFFGLFIGYHWAWGNNKAMRTLRTKLAKVKTGKLPAKKVVKDVRYICIELAGTRNNSTKSKGKVTVDEVLTFIEPWVCIYDKKEFKRSMSQYLENYGSHWYLILPASKVEDFKSAAEADSNACRDIFRGPTIPSSGDLDHLVNTTTGTYNLKWY